MNIKRDRQKAMRNRTIIIHVICWSLVLFMPFFFLRSVDTENTLRWGHFMRTVGGPLGYIVMFYVNYLWLVPRFYEKGHRLQFVVGNVALAVVALAIMHGWDMMVRELMPMPWEHNGRPPRPRHDPDPFRWPMMFGQLLNLVMVMSLALAVRLSQHWNKLEEARVEAERVRTEAELKNLRNQLNPHFLLNTLNNIYALVAFDQDKAQHAVLELSKLLRHVLYDNQQEFVPLCREVAFMQNYVELMKIRVASGVVIEEHNNIAPDDATPITPLIFISLIENAFKHGISSQGVGHISITIDNSDGVVSCEIVNTNHPKRDTDKSGSGIGLQQVQRRLDLACAGHYTWQKGVTTDGKQYYSKITIDTKHKD